ncbi:hypothetical protein FOA52_004760, partial [Chlamydomonas sp. UWO 241]
GHVYRVLTYALHFLGDVNHPKRDAIALALVHHDIGLWADEVLGYIEPSQVRGTDAAAALGWDAEQIQLVDDIIHWHHKTSPFEGLNADVVNAVMKADLVDFSISILSMGLPWAHTKTVVKAIPLAGFHTMLLWMPIKLKGLAGLPQGLMEFMSIFKR